MTVRLFIRGADAMIRYALACIWLAMAVAIGAGPAAANLKRVALVIGMADYQHAPRLSNTLNDADDMAEALKRLNFTVIVGRNLDKVSLDRIVRQFAEALHGADVGLFYYAGHAVQIDGHNHMVPVDAKLDRESSLDFEATRLDLVHRTMEREAKTNLLFLDACRDNPLARNLARSLGTRSTKIGHGLATVESGEGTLIAFSTQPGNVALDGDGRNSPYTAALLRHMTAPGEDLSSILIRVRNDVMRATERKQVPWEHSALTARFFFSPPDASVTKQATDEESLWASIKGSTLPGAYEHYLERFPNGRYVLEARAELARLKPPQDTRRSAEPISIAPAPLEREAEKLFTERDRDRVEQIARKHQFVLPPFQIVRTDASVPERLRRFVGVWVDESGYKGMGRRGMIIVTAAAIEGRIAGYYLYGPPDATSFNQGPADAIIIDSSIERDGFKFQGQKGDARYNVTLAANGTMQYFYQNSKGQTTTRTFTPVWRLLDAERKAGR